MAKLLELKDILDLFDKCQEESGGEDELIQEVDSTYSDRDKADEQAVLVPHSTQTALGKVLSHP